KAGIIMNISCEVNRISQNQLKFWSNFYDQLRMENPKFYGEQGKLLFLENTKTREETEISSFLTSWSTLLSDEERQYVLQLLREGLKLELNPLDLNSFNPSAVSAFLMTHPMYNNLYGVDKFLELYAHQRLKATYGLETKS